MFIISLNSLHQKLQPIFSKYLEIENSINKSTSIREKVLEILNQNNILLISANSSKKKLKKIGIDPRQIIVSGGPLFVEDYKTLNPKIQKEALENIKKKCLRLVNQIKAENWKDKDLVFIYEEGNATDELILKKSNKITELISKKLKTLKIESWELIK